MGADITAVIVTYRSAEMIEDCLRSLDGAGTSHSVRAVVVDNASDDGSVDVVARVASEIATPVEVVARGTNDGFGVGCNVGLARADGQWVLFLNPDTKCPPGALDALVATAEAHPRAGIVAPALVGRDGRVQPTLERVYRLGRVVLGLVRIGGANRPYPPPESGPPIEVPWVHAAAILMRVEVARSVHGFDERFFLYAEDMDLCARVRAAGWTVLVVPEVRVAHIGGASAAVAGGEAMVAGRRVHGMTLFLSVHQGRAAALVFAALTVMSASVMAALDRVRRRSAAGHVAMAGAASRVLLRGGAADVRG